MVAAYLGHERPKRLTAVKIDREQEDADFEAAMRAFDSGNKSDFDATEIPGSK